MRGVEWEKTIRRAGCFTMPPLPSGESSTATQDIKMGNKEHEPGAFLRIHLSDGSFGYGRLLELPYAAFYGYRTTTPDSDLDRIASKPILFKTAVRTHLAPESWENIGHRELEPT